MRFASAALMTLALTACGGGGGSAAPPAAAVPQLAGGAVKGPLAGASVCFYALSGGVQGARLAIERSDGATGTLANGCYVTGEDGTYGVRLSAGYTGDVLVESTGGTYCSDESRVSGGACAAPATLLAMGAGVLRTVLTAAAGTTSTGYATPVTTAAVATTPAPLNASSFAQQYASVATALGIDASESPASPPGPTTRAALAQVAAHVAGGGLLADALAALGAGSTTFALAPAASYTVAFATPVLGSVTNTATVQWRTSGALAAFDMGEPGSLSAAQMTVSEVSGSALVQIGRWHSGPLAGSFPPHVQGTTTLILTAAHGLHYAVAAQPASMPCNGTATYTLTAGTALTRVDGSVVTGTLQSLDIAATFLGGSMELEATGVVVLNSINVIVTGTSAIRPSPDGRFALSLTPEVGGLGALGLNGIFAGTWATEIGATWSGLAPFDDGGAARSVLGAARLTRTAGSITGGTCDR